MCKKNDWISVNDKLPEYRKNVLITVGHGWSATAKKKVVTGYRKNTDHEGEHWQSEICGPVTHWQDLLEPAMD